MGQKTGKTGPDPKPKSLRRSACVMVRLTASEYKQLEHDAAAAKTKTKTKRKDLAPFLVECWKAQRKG